MPCILLSFVCLYFIRGGGGVLFVLGRGGEGRGVYKNYSVSFK